MAAEKRQPEPGTDALTVLARKAERYAAMLYAKNLLPAPEGTGQPEAAQSQPSAIQARSDLTSLTSKRLAADYQNAWGEREDLRRPTQADIADLYGVKRRTLQRWLTAHRVKWPPA